jgi:hypothetical protein
MVDTELSVIKNSADRLRVLCISPLFLPYNDSEAICGGKIIKALQDCGVDVAVITFDILNPKYRVKDDSSLWNGLEKSIFHIPPPHDQERFSSAIAVFRYRTIEWARWLNKMLKTVEELHNNKPFDIVYSRSIPKIAHVAAYWVSDKYRIPWIAMLMIPGLFNPGVSQSALHKAFYYW